MIDNLKIVINKGDIIDSSLWPEPVEVKLIEKTDSYIHLIGITTVSRSAIDQIIPEDEAINDEELIKKIKKSIFKYFILYISSKGIEKTDTRIEKIHGIAQKIDNFYSAVVANNILKE